MKINFGVPLFLLCLQITAPAFAKNFKSQFTIEKDKYEIRVQTTPLTNTVSSRNLEIKARVFLNGKSAYFDDSLMIACTINPKTEAVRNPIRLLKHKNQDVGWILQGINSCGSQYSSEFKLIYFKNKIARTHTFNSKDDPIVTETETGLLDVWYQKQQSLFGAASSLYMPHRVFDDGINSWFELDVFPADLSKWPKQIDGGPVAAFSAGAKSLNEELMKNAIEAFLKTPEECSYLQTWGIPCEKEKQLVLVKALMENKDFISKNLLQN